MKKMLKYSLLAISTNVLFFPATHCGGKKNFRYNPRKNKQHNLRNNKFKNRQKKQHIKGFQKKQDESIATTMWLNSLAKDLPAKNKKSTKTRGSHRPLLYNSKQSFVLAKLLWFLSLFMGIQANTCKNLHKNTEYTNSKLSPFPKDCDIFTYQISESFCVPEEYKGAVEDYCKSLKTNFYCTDSGQGYCKEIKNNFNAKSKDDAKNFREVLRSKSPNYCGTLLLQASNDCNKNKIKEILKCCGPDTAASHYGNEALIRAADRDCGQLLEVVKLLVENGADINAVYNHGNTALHKAAYNNRNLEIVKFLVENGADINRANKYGDTALHIALYSHIAIHNNRNLEIIKFLVENGADINIAGNQGDTALHLAASYRCLEIVKFLVENGADINTANNKGQTALWGANKEITEFLKKNLDTPFDHAIEWVSKVVMITQLKDLSAIAVCTIACIINKAKIFRMVKMVKIMLKKYHLQKLNTIGLKKEISENIKNIDTDLLPYLLILSIDRSFNKQGEKVRTLVDCFCKEIKKSQNKEKIKNILLAKNKIELKKITPIEILEKFEKSKHKISTKAKKALVLLRIRRKDFSERLEYVIQICYFNH